MCTYNKIMSPVHRGTFASSFEIRMPFFFFLASLLCLRLQVLRGTEMVKVVTFILFRSMRKFFSISPLSVMFGVRVLCTAFTMSGKFLSSPTFFDGFYREWVWIFQFFFCAHGDDVPPAPTSSSVTMVCYIDWFLMRNYPCFPRVNLT